MTCLNCGENFSGHGNQKYCDTQCYYEAHKNRSLQRYHNMNDDDKEKVHERAWRSNLMTKFGLTPVDYAELYANQGGRCAICEVEQKDEDRRFAVDHDHETGKVRELLCASCNKGLGHFKDNFNILIAAAIYLKRHQ